MKTRERLEALLQRDFGVPADALHADATLEGLGIDSLRMIEILFCIEEEFGISVTAEPAELRARLKTFGDLAGYIDALANDGGAAA
ncbi:MAG: acyl carrier protein [Usitatibacter sp.]